MKKLILIISFILLLAGCSKNNISTPLIESSSVYKYDDVDFNDVFDIKNVETNEENPKQLMAHNIYSDPDLSEMSGKYSEFQIDFKADYAPEGTYWALCNWNMDLSSYSNAYDTGGAYCGLQQTSTGPKAIMSFWNMEIDGEIVTPTLVYPINNGNGYFDNEGSGANYIVDYDWQAGKWYTLNIRSYKDKTTGNIFVEMKVKAVNDSEWDLICIYDTKLTNSYFTGDMSQFMENYDYKYASKLRSFQYANLYIKELDSEEFKPITRSKLSIDTWWENKKGTYEFGSTSTNLWGITFGFGEDSAPLNSDISSYEIVNPTKD